MGRTKESQADQQQFWQMAIDTWQSSGLSVRNFCKQEGLSEPVFYNWRRKLADNNPGPGRQDHLNPTPFVEVSIPQNSAVLELVLSSGNTLRISSGTDRQILNDVLSILHQVGLC